jgi:hypothetical protein
VRNLYLVVTATFLLAACGGGSGGGTSVPAPDTVAPSVTAPSAAVFAAVDAAGTPASSDGIAAFLQGATATDDVDGSVSVINDAPDVFSLGDTTVTFSASDVAGNTGTASAVVTVTDQAAPALSVPADSSFVATSAAGIAASDTALVDFLAQATATDNVDAAITVSNDAPSTFPIGDTTVTFSAADAAGNTNSGSAVVTVTGASQSGTAEKGPLFNATVFFDYDGDKELDANEPSTLTDIDGRFELAETSDAPADYTIVMQVNEDTIDSISGESYADSGVTLEAVKGSTVITPMTTLYSLAVTDLDEGEELSVEAFSVALGLPSDLDVNTYSAFAKDTEGEFIDVAVAAQVEAVAQSLMTTLEVISESIVSISQTALKSGEGISQTQAAAVALKSLVNVVVATVAENAAAADGVVADAVDLSNVADIAEVNAAVLESLNSAEADSLGALLETAAEEAGVIVDKVAAEVTGSVVLTLSTDTVAAVSQAFADLSAESFGQVEASAVSLIKAQAVAEIAAAAEIVVEAVSEQQEDNVTVVLAVEDVDVSAVITLDNEESLNSTIVENVQVVEAYLETTVAPKIDSDGSFDAAENQTSVGAVIVTDTVGDVLTYSLSGTDASALSISSAGVITFVEAPDFEAKALYEVTVTVVDSDGNSVTQAISISITDANDSAPVITSSSSFSVNENQSVIGSVVATSASSEALTYTLSGVDAAALTISADGVLGFVAIPDFEAKASYSATVAVSDGANETSSVITVSIVNLNDSTPVIGSVREFVVNENVKSVGIITAIDADFDNLSYALSGDDASAFTISSLGSLRFITAPNFEVNSSYSVTVTVSDGVSASSAEIAVTVRNINDVAPVFASAAAFSAAENQTSIGTVTATDADSSAVTFSVSGTELEISSEGELSFVSAPDFEVNTSFTATVTVTDGDLTASQVVTVTVTDIDDTFTLADTDVILTDYYPLDGSAVINTLDYTVVGNMASVDLRAAPLNLTNMENAVFGGDFRTPVLSFGLSTLPIGSGADTISINLLDGLDSSVDSGERQVNVELNVEWESDGTTASITVPAQTISAFYKTVAGVQVDVEIVNADSDVLTITSGGAAYPATLEVKLVSLITQFNSLPLGDILSSGVYHLDVTTSLPLKAATGESVEGVSTIVEFADAFKLADAAIALQDTNPLDGSTVETDHEVTLVDGFLSVDLRSAPISLLNIRNGLNGLSFISPRVSFALSAIPSGAGTETVTINLIDGVDSVRDSGERQVTVALDIEWDADGTAATITVPAQDTSAFYITSSGVQIDVALSDADLDVLSITSAGADYPASLELKLLSLIAKLSGFPLDELLTNGVFHIDVTTSMPLIAPSGLKVDGLKAIIEIADAFTLADAAIALQDTNPLNGSTVKTDHEVTLVDGFLSVDLRSAPLSLLNIENGLNGLPFISPRVSFALSAIPSGAGTETVTINLIDGVDAVRDSGERQVTVALDIEWDADGTAATIAVPAQDTSAFYITSSGVQIDVALSDAELDVLSITSAGPDYPASLELKLLSLITKLSGFPLDELLTTGVFHVDVTTSMPLIAPNGLAVDGLKAIIEIADAFTLADSTVTLLDFDPAYELIDLSDHQAVLVDGFLTVDLSSAPLSLLNIENGLNGSEFTSPKVSFDLSGIPYGAGSETVTINLVDGLDASRDVGERRVTVALGFDWDANGTSAELTVPAQDVSAYYVTADGVQVDVALGNADLDMLSVTSSGAEYPASLEVKLLSLITKLNGLPLADLLSAGVFHVELTTSMPLIAPSGLAVEGLKAIIEIADTTSDSVGGGSEADE